MALTKETQIESIKFISETDEIQIFTDEIIKEDGKELTRKSNARIIKSDMSDEDLAKEDGEVQKIAKIAWSR